MAAKMKRRMALPRKLHILRTLTKSKSVKRSSIIMDAFLYIYKLKLQVEAIKREYQYLINHIQEVKVEKVGTGHLRVMVRCKKAEELVVSILEAFERVNVNVVEARISCKHFFGMEAIVEDTVDAAVLSDAILKVPKHGVIVGALSWTMSGSNQTSMRAKGDMNESDPH